MLPKTIKYTSLFTIIILFSVACGSETEQTSNSDYSSHRSYDASNLEPITIEYQSDHCDYSDKEIRSKRFGAELETEDGSHYKFCSAEHMIAFMLADETITEDNARVRVVEFVDGGHLIHPSETTFLKTPNQPSPGGMNYLPMKKDQTHAISRMQDLYTGDLLSWEEAQQEVAEKY